MLYVKEKYAYGQSPILMIKRKRLLVMHYEQSLLHKHDQAEFRRSKWTLLFLLHTRFFTTNVFIFCLNMI